MRLFKDLVVCIPTGAARWNENLQGRGQDL